LRSLAYERRRFGFRRLGILLQREGIVMNRKKLLRLYREDGLAVRRRMGRKRALYAGTGPCPIAPSMPPKAPSSWSPSMAN
jgi:transposase InsO family protein